MTGEQRKVLNWLNAKGDEGVELWRFPGEADLAALLSRRLVAIGTAAGDQRLRVWATPKAARMIARD
jgi:hypothetical protein